MLMNIPTWKVSVHRDDYGDEEWRVPETNLDSFLHVLTFNKRLVILAAFYLLCSWMTDRWGL